MHRPVSDAARKRLTDWLGFNGKWLTRTDGETHTHLRSLAQLAFTPRAVQRMAGRVQQVADDLIDDRPSAHHMDVIADFAWKLPLTVIADMLGIPSLDHNQIRTWSRSMKVQVSKARKGLDKD